VLMVRQTEEAPSLPPLPVEQVRLAKHVLTGRASE
jgi:hypothetical protein